MKRMFSVLLLIISLLIAGCTTPASNRNQCAKLWAERSIAPTEQEIASLFDRWNLSLQSGDPQQVVANYAEWSILLPTVSNKPRLTRTEKEDYFHHFLENQPSGEITMRFPKPKTPASFLSSRPEVTEDDIIPLVLSKKTKEELEEMVDFYSGHGTKAYEALATIHSIYVAERLRADLRDHFEGLRNKSIDKLKSQLGEQTSALILEKYKQDLEKFIRDKFASLAIKGIAKLSEESDIVIAREYIGRTDYGMADDSCILIIEKYGDSTDIDRLIDVAKRTYGSSRGMAIRVAVKLSDNPEKLIQELLQSQDKNISELATYQIPSLGKEERIVLAKELLYSQHDNVRLLAAKIISKNLDRNDIEEILNEYIEKPTYYYNVVYFLDNYLLESPEFSIIRIA